jgi:hypothetical protein
MSKPGIFAAVALGITGAIAILAASTASPRMPPSFGAQIDPSSMMTHTHDLPAQRITDFSNVFVGP